MRIFLFPVVLLTSFAALASNIRSRGLAMEGVSLTDPMALLSNPSAPGDTNASVLQAFAEDRYGIELLASRGVAFASGKARQRIGVELTQTGTSVYNRKRISLATGINLFQKARFGIGLLGEAQSIRFPQESSTRLAWSSVLGWYIKALPGTSIGLVVTGPESLLSTARYRLEQPTLRFGLSWNPNRSVTWSLETTQRAGSPTILSTGLRYLPNKSLELACGWRSDHMLLSLGVGFQHKKCRLDLAFEQHRQLGTRSSISLLYFLSTRR